MKKDLVTAIAAAIAGFLVSFLVISSITGEPDSVLIKTLDNTIDSTLANPNIEVFNYRAVNPTVEAYVDCTNYDLTGNCRNQDEDNKEEVKTKEEDFEEDFEEFYYYNHKIQ